MKQPKKKTSYSPRLRDYLPDHPRFDHLRSVFIANELKRAEQLELLPAEKWRVA